MTSLALLALGAFVLAPVGMVLVEMVRALRHETWRGP